MYKIIGSYRGGAFEEVDTAGTLSAARTLLAEYRLAYGPNWSLIFYNTEE